MSHNTEKHVNSIIQDKWKKVEDIKTMGIEPFGRKYEKKNMISDLLAGEAEDGVTYKTAGRMTMQIKVMMMIKRYKCKKITRK